MSVIALAWTNHLHRAYRFISLFPFCHFCPFSALYVYMHRYVSRCAACSKTIVRSRNYSYTEVSTEISCRSCACVPGENFNIFKIVLNTPQVNMLDLEIYFHKDFFLWINCSFHQWKQWEFNRKSYIFTFIFLLEEFSWVLYKKINIQLLYRKSMFPQIDLPSRDI